MVVTMDPDFCVDGDDLALPPSLYIETIHVIERPRKNSSDFTDSPSSRRPNFPPPIRRLSLTQKITQEQPPRSLFARFSRYQPATASQRHTSTNQQHQKAKAPAQIGTAGWNTSLTGRKIEIHSRRHYQDDDDNNDDQLEQHQEQKQHNRNNHCQDQAQNIREHDAIMLEQILCTGADLGLDENIHRGQKQGGGWEFRFGLAQRVENDSITSDHFHVSLNTSTSTMTTTTINTKPTGYPIAEQELDIIDPDDPDLTLQWTSSVSTTNTDPAGKDSSLDILHSSKDKERYTKSRKVHFFKKFLKRSKKENL